MHQRFQQQIKMLRQKGVITVDPTPLRTPTIVVVRAEFTIVHQNMVKLRMIPITREMTRITLNDREAVCNSPDDVS